MKMGGVLFDFESIVNGKIVKVAPSRFFPRTGGAPEKGPTAVTWSVDRADFGAFLQAMSFPTGPIPTFRLPCLWEPHAMARQPPREDFLPKNGMVSDV
jgi:hypothetical protein